MAAEAEYRDEVTGGVAFRFPSAVRLLRGIRPRGGCGRLRLLGGVPADSVKMAVKLECPPLRHVSTRRVFPPFHVVCEIHWQYNWLFLRVNAIPVVGIQRQLQSVSDHLLSPVDQ